jgi:F-type H+-transporting ATPase subunit epsilon
MNDTMKIEIATSAGIVYTADARMVTLPAVDGRISIFAHHMPMLTRITPGELIVRTSNGQDDVLAVGEGLVAVTSNHIGIVTEMAIAGRDAQAPVRKHRRG